jgi:hypothetical protein
MIPPVTGHAMAKRTPSGDVVRGPTTKGERGAPLSFVTTAMPSTKVT